MKSGNQGYYVFDVGFVRILAYVILRDSEESWD